MWSKERVEPFWWNPLAFVVSTSASVGLGWLIWEGVSNREWILAGSFDWLWYAFLSFLVSVGVVLASLAFAWDWPRRKRAEGRKLAAETQHQQSLSEQ